MPNLPDWIWAGTIGAAATAVILLLARGALGPSGLRWTAAAAAIAFVAACGKLGLIQRFPPVASEQWLPIAAVALGLVGTIDARWTMPAAARWAAALLLCAGLSILLFHPFAHTVWEGQNPLKWIGLIAVVMLAAWGSADEMERHSPAGPLVLAVVGLCGGVIASLSGYLSIGPVALALGAACGIVFLFQLVTRQGRGLAIVAGPLLVSILFLTFVTANLTRLNLCLVLAALFLPHILTPFVRRRPKLAMILQSLVSLIPLAIALALAKKAFDAASQELGIYG